MTQRSRRIVSREDDVHRAGQNHLRQVTGLPAVPATVEFRELRYFAVLCEELHFSRAAERLHISQSPLSQTIAQLERKLGTRLLDRSSRYVRLTPAGQVLLEHSQRLLEELEDAVGATRRAGAGEGGPLRIAVGPVSREAILPALRHELDERFPNLVVEVVEEVGDAMLDGLLQGASDVVIMLSPPSRTDVGFKPLRRDRPIAVVHHDHPLAKRSSVTLDELAQYTLVLGPRGLAKGSHDLVLSLFHGHKPASTRIADLNSGPFWDAMLAGGFAVLPSSAAFSGDFVALPIEGTKEEFTLSMVWSTHTPPALLSGLIDAADAAIVANGWL
jgi:DNA-binding transcriptional LysR family regulator